MKKFLDTLVVTQKQLDDTVDNDVFWEIVPPYGISGQLFSETINSFVSQKSFTVFMELC